ncbi:hypothetical protein [Dokdonella soli]|uniref:Uncharacterized protein n=1 Tax=Dokdonella soli TaxID=529810 RepID=A0ABN1ID24_9GAMM
MFKRCVAPMLALFFAFSAQSAHAFLNPPYLTPAHPTPSDTVSVNVYGGQCDAFTGSPVLPVVTQLGNAITLVSTGAHSDDPLFCVFGVGTETIPIGSYAIGSYTVTVIWRYTDFIGNNVQQTLGVLPFTVTAPPPTPVALPTLGGAALSILLFALIGFAAWALRSQRLGLPLVALALLSLGARAQDPQPSQTIQLLVSTASGAPTADQLVAYYSSKQLQQAGPPPLQGLTVGNPQQVTYLLTPRATGDFLARLQAHPNSVRAQLERYVVVLYPAGTNLASALSALQSDPYVLSAYVPLSMDFSSASLTSFSVVGNDPLNLNQYGRTDLNIDAAWQLAGGGVLTDRGHQHRALRQPSCIAAVFEHGPIRRRQLHTHRLLGHQYRRA